MLLKRALTGDGGIARCRDARTPVEQAICSDPALAAKIADRGEVDEAGRNGAAGDVRHPQLVGSAAADGLRERSCSRANPLRVAPAAYSCTICFLNERLWM